MVPIVWYLINVIPCKLIDKNNRNYEVGVYFKRNFSVIFRDIGPMREQDFVDINFNSNKNY